MYSFNCQNGWHHNCTCLIHREFIYLLYRHYCFPRMTSRHIPLLIHQPLLKTRIKVENGLVYLLGVTICYTRKNKGTWWIKIYLLQVRFWYKVTYEKEWILNI